ncbi:MAG: 4,5-DOPA dioxygenase extradiol [Bacteroidota bacterium]
MTDASKKRRHFAEAIDVDRRGVLAGASGWAALGLLAPVAGCQGRGVMGGQGTAAANRPEGAHNPAQERTTMNTTSTSPEATTRSPSNQARMPVLFVGHGSPMNAIEDNKWSRGFQAMADLFPTPKAVLSISAHWFLGGTFVTGNEHPKTIHDFGGFPDQLFQMQYPAPGQVDLAKRIVHLLGERRGAIRHDWGLDHGTWSVLHHLRPAADVPVVQLSIDANLPVAGHLELGRALAPLREEGVLIMGSGNVTHNLRHAMTSYSRGDLSTPPWAATFDAEVERAAIQHDGAFLARAIETPAGRQSHPTLDHFLPLAYTLGASDKNDRVTFPISGFDLGSLSMRSILFG